jgi:hypothetical protein
MPQSVQLAPETMSEQAITDAYIYLLGRLLVLRQERLDFEKEAFEWNKLLYREPGAVSWANPNLDVAYCEAWVALDENAPVLVEIPKIAHRYYTWQMLNGWGETILNINERTFPEHPCRKFALCLAGSNPSIPEDALRVDLRSKKSRVLARVELGADARVALRLQRQFKLSPLGIPQIDRTIEVPLFTNDQLPGAEALDHASEILTSEPDVNKGMNEIQTIVRSVERLERSGREARRRVDETIRQYAIPSFYDRLRSAGATRNGWQRPMVAGNYGSDYSTRSLMNFAGIWANNSDEAIYFVAHVDERGRALHGSNVYTIIFPGNRLPENMVRYFWSVIAVDSMTYHVVPNRFKRYLLNKESPLRYAEDGSLTLVFASTKPDGFAESNWLPTPDGQEFQLTFRFYGPSRDVVDGTYFPPPLLRS